MLIFSFTVQKALGSWDGYVLTLTLIIIVTSTQASSRRRNKADDILVSKVN